MKIFLNDYGPSQIDKTSSLAPGGDIDLILAQANGDPVKLAQLLNLSENIFVGKKLVRVDVANPKSVGLRLPNGNEGGANSNHGANEQWLPGGQLSNGSSEAVVIVDKTGEGTNWKRIQLNF